MFVTDADPHPVAMQRGPSASRRAVNSKYLFRMRLVKYAEPRHYKSFSWGLWDQMSWYLRSMPYSCAFGGLRARCQLHDQTKKYKKNKKIWSPLSLLYKSLYCIPHTCDCEARWDLWDRKSMSVGFLNFWVLFLKIF